MKCSFPSCHSEAAWVCYFSKGAARQKRGGLTLCQAHRNQRDEAILRHNPDSADTWCEYDPLEVH
jgi:hypothetical protein